MPDNVLLTSCPGYLLNKLGQLSLGLFTDQLAALGLRPKHCGLLAIASQMGAVSQQDLGTALGLVPSAIVAIIDDLEAMKAISRASDANDRRRYVIGVTARGRQLLEKATQLAQRVDEQLLAPLNPKERLMFQDALMKLMAGLDGLSST